MATMVTKIEATSKQPKTVCTPFLVGDHFKCFMHFFQKLRVVVVVHVVVVGESRFSRGWKKNHFYFTFYIQVH